MSTEIPTTQEERDYSLTYKPDRKVMIDQKKTAQKRTSNTEGY